MRSTVGPRSSSALSAGGPPGRPLLISAPGPGGPAPVASPPTPSMLARKVKLAHEPEARGHAQESRASGSAAAPRHHRVRPPDGRPDGNVALAPRYRPSNSPFFVPVRNAPISARV